MFSNIDYIKTNRYIEKALIKSEIFKYTITLKFVITSWQVETEKQASLIFYMQLLDCHQRPFTFAKADFN